MRIHCLISPPHPHLTSPSFVSAVAAAVTGAVLDTGSVVTVVLTRNPSPAPTMAPVAAATTPAAPSGNPAAENDDDGDDESMLQSASSSLLVLGVAIGAILFICAAGVYFGVYRRSKGSEGELESEILNGDDLDGYGLGKSEMGADEPPGSEGDVEMMATSNTDDIADLDYNPSRAACVDFLSNKAGLDGSDVYEKMLVEARVAVQLEGKRR